MEIKRVFLDVDGVLANWCKGAHRVHNLPYDQDVWPYARGTKGWDWYKELGITTKQLFEPMGYEFWRTLEWEPWGAQLYGKLYQRFRDRLYLLTSPALTKGAVDGRLAWISDNMPSMRERTLIGSCKEACANPDTVLIDDCSANVRTFMDAGGQGVLVPRAHNELHYMRNPDVVSWVMNNLDHVEALSCQEF